jgi:hypothetical protein
MVIIIIMIMSIWLLELLILVWSFTIWLMTFLKIMSHLKQNLFICFWPWQYIWFHVNCHILYWIFFLLKIFLQHFELANFFELVNFLLIYFFHQKNKTKKWHEKKCKMEKHSETKLHVFFNQGMKFCFKMFLVKFYTKHYLK